MSTLEDLTYTSMNLSEFMLPVFLCLHMTLYGAFMILMTKICPGWDIQPQSDQFQHGGICSTMLTAETLLSWGSHQASNELFESQPQTTQFFCSMILSHVHRHMWNLSSIYGADYGLIPTGYQAISWTSPGNLIIYTHEWSYIGVPNRMQYIDGSVHDCSNSIANALELLQSYTKSSIWAIYQGTLVAMPKISSRLQRVNQTSGLTTTQPFFCGMDFVTYTKYDWG